MWTPMDVLQKFYWEAYWIARNKAPHWMFIMDASFRGGAVAEGGFMKGCRNKAVDKHPYHAWAGWCVLALPSHSLCAWGRRVHAAMAPYVVSWRSLTRPAPPPPSLHPPILPLLHHPSGRPPHSRTTAAAMCGVRACVRVRACVCVRVRACVCAILLQGQDAHLL